MSTQTQVRSTEEALSVEDTLKLALEALKVAEHFVEEYAASKYYYAHVVAIAAAEEALAQPEQEPVAWKPDRSGKYFTAVYRDLIPGDEVGAIVDHPKCVIMSWSNAVHDVEQLSNTTPPQRTWVGLKDEETAELVHRYAFYELTRQIEAKLKEKNNVSR